MGYRSASESANGPSAARTAGSSRRVVVYTDGISARTTSKGFFGIDGITRAARDAEAWTAHAMARAIQEAVAGASRRPLRDDAAVVVLAPAAESSRTPPTARSGGS